MYGEKIIEISAGNNIDCGIRLTGWIQDGIIKIEYRGGCWVDDVIDLIITKDEILVSENGRMRRFSW